MLQSYFLPIKKKYQSNNETFWFSCHMFYIDPLTNRCCQILIQQENKEIEATLLFDSYILLGMTLLTSLTLLNTVLHFYKKKLIGNFKFAKLKL